MAVYPVDMIKFQVTKVGSLLGKFTDRYGAQCSLQESSYQEELCLWVGVEVDAMGEANPNGRMHITQDQARELAEALLYFANEGGLGKYDAAQHFRVGSWVRGLGKDNFGIYGRILAAHVGGFLTVQDQSTSGEAGQYTCVWDHIHKIWSPAEVPPEGASRYEFLNADESV
jgi:hypothetical protein